MRYRVQQDSRLHYRTGVSDARLNLRLRPVAWPGQVARDFTMELDVPPTERTDAPGPYLSHVTTLRYSGRLSSLRVVTQFTAELSPMPVPALTPPVAELRQEASDARTLGPLAPAAYLYGASMTPPDEAIGAWAAPDLPPGAPVLDAARALAARIHREFAYAPGTTTSRTLPAEAFAAKAGVCQDFAQVMIVALRMHGIPAGYVSGYLRTLPPPGRARLVGADAMHAWAAVWCGPEAGWIGIDPTNDSLARDDHIVLGMGRDYADVTPVNGVFVGGGKQTTDFRVDVVPVDETMANIAPPATASARRTG